MATEAENGVVQPTPDELAEAEKFKEEANLNFKSENLTYLFLQYS